MANVYVTDTYLSDIADAIRSKSGLSETYRPIDMGPAIDAINLEVGVTADMIATGDFGSSISGNASSIAGFAFYNCSSLVSVNFPDCTIIGSYAFNSCIALTTANFSSCTSIGSYAFRSCSALTTINFPNCTHIENCAFQYCSVLTTASFPICTSIKASAFYNCYNLLSLNLTSVSVVTTLTGTSVFYSTPIGGRTTSTGGVYGSVYVPASLLTSFKKATNWTAISSRIVGV